MSTMPNALKASIRAPGTRSAPSSKDPSQAKMLARRHLRARKALTRRIRRVIALATVCAFLGIWLLIFGVLLAGRDPALSASTRNTVAIITSSGSKKSQANTRAKASSPKSTAITSVSSQRSNLLSSTQSNSSSTPSKTSTVKSQGTSETNSSSEPSAVSTRQS